MVKPVLSTRVDQTQKELFEKFTPYYGKSPGDVMRSLALRWIEANITSPTVIDLAKRGHIKLELTDINKEKEGTKMTICIKCGTEYKIGQKFCRFCGNNLVEVEG